MIENGNTRRLPYFITGIIILGVAFWLRAAALDARFLWWDEGLTVAFGTLSLQDGITFARRTADVNPPVYRYLIGAWGALVGYSVLSVRMVNVWLGTLNVALGAALAKSPRRRMLTALILALSPIAIYFSREAKGYALVMTALLVQIHLWERIRARRPTHPAILFGGGALATFAALGSNYLAVLVLGTLDLYILFDAVRGALCGRGWQAWAVGQAVGAAALIPFVLATLGTTAAGLAETSASTVAPRGPLTYAFQMAYAFLAGPEPHPMWDGPAVTHPEQILAGLLIGGILIAAGIAARRRELLVIVLVPLALGFIFQMRYAWFFPRFLLAIGALLAILMAAGVEKLRRAGGILLAGLLAIWLSVNAAYLTLPFDAAEDPRPLFSEIGPVLKPDDAVLYALPWMHGYWRVALPDAPPVEMVLGFLHERPIWPSLWETHPRVWLLNYERVPGPHFAPGSWFLERGAMIWAAGTKKLHAALFAHPEPLPLEKEAAFGEIALRYPTLNMQAAPGDAVAFPLEWTLTEPAARDWVIYLHMLDNRGHVIAQTDSAPRNATLSFTAQPAGEPLREARGVLVPPEAAPGTYSLKLGLYDWQTGERAVTFDGEDGIIIGTVQIKD